jgi:hypothetical protein
MAALIYRGQQNDPSKGSAIFQFSIFWFLNYYFFDEIDLFIDPDIPIAILK